MMIGDPKHIERLANFGIDVEKDDDIDTSYAGLSQFITVHSTQVEKVVVPALEGESNA